jgi:proton-translocating NADH-quinone oxidoreductase chain N
MSETLPLWLIGLPLITSPFVYVAGHLNTRRPVISRWIALGGLAAAWIVFAQTAREVLTYGKTETYVGMIAIRVDGISLLLAALALTLCTLVLLFSATYMAGETNEEKYYALLVALIGAMIGLACAADLFNLWVWFELMAVSSYLLVAFYSRQPASLEAGVKYLVQSTAGSVLVLVGIALVMLQTGTLDLDMIRAAQPSPTLLAAGALFVVGFGVKAAIVPFHTWLPDAHSQAPSGISAMLSGVVIGAGLIALLRTLGALAGVTLSWGILLMGFGAFNMLAGNLLALRQRQVKRLLAFSSLSHVGYMLLGLGIAVYSGQPDGAQGGFFHLLNHGLMKGLAFLAAGVFLYALHLAQGDHSPLTIADLSGAARRYPLAAFAFSVALLGLGGLPPLAGFMSKWQIFAAGFESGNGLIEALIVFAALNSVLSLVYYVPLVNVLYRQKASRAMEQGARLSVGMQAPLWALSLAVVAIGIWPGLVSWLTEPAGAALVSLFGH